MNQPFNEFISKIQLLPTRVGSISPAQQSFFRKFIADHPEIHTVLETGFHIGLSAATFLDVRPDINVVSFDIFWFDYTRRAKLLLDIAYPKRNLLIAGNSVVSLPMWFSLTNQKPDLVFIDGGHEKPVPAIDLYHILRELPSGTWVIIDDYCLEHGTHGVIEAIDACINRGELVNANAYKALDRGWVVAQRGSVPVAPLFEVSMIDSVMRDVESHYN
jgi:hypothetical protein